ncbi:MAG: hydrogenase maturation protease [Chromatiaceae bacterium]|nr:MAG: hydrogenase maturation protease [Chromatiaceae bacterium]
MRALIIGYGSPIRGDDAIGPLAADRLAAMDLPPDITVQARHILTAELVDDLRQVERVIFLDAAADSAPGEVRCRPLAPDPSAPSTMAHFHDPRELLAWCDTLYGHHPQAWLVTAGGADFGYANYRLSPLAEQALTRMLQQVLELLEFEQGHSSSLGEAAVAGVQEGPRY